MADHDTMDGLVGPWGSVRPAAPTFRWNLRVAPADRGQAEAAWGGALPAAMLRAEGDERRAALHLEPDDWLLLSADPAAADGLRGTGLPPLSLVEVTDRQIGLICAGPGVRDLLVAGIPLDLSAQAMPVGAATRTVCGKVEVVIWRLPDTPAGPSFRLEVWRSYAPYLQAFLSAAARDL